MQQLFDRAGTGEVQKNTVLVLFELGGHFEEGQDQRRGLGVGQRGLLEGVCAQSVMQDIGSTGQEEPQTVGEERRRRRAVAMELAFHGLDSILAIAAGAGEVRGQHLWGRGRKRRDHKTWVITRRHHFGFEDDPPWLGSGGCGIGKLCIQTAAGGRTCAMGLREGGALLVQTARFLHDRFGMTQ